MSELTTVISGGQVGADIAGLRAGHKSGLRTGGWMTLGYRTKRGALDPAMVKLYGLEEMLTADYPSRTAQNIIASDATIRFAHNFNSAGERLTRKLCLKYQKPMIDLHVVVHDRLFVVEGDYEKQARAALQVVRFLRFAEVQTLNVAGNADERIEMCVEGFLTVLFRMYQRGEGVNEGPEQD